ncbi:MAG: hypothetical protein ACO1OO_04165 [Flavisolibacter sp.]
MTLQQRLTAPTPKFFKTIRNIGLILASASAVILASPVVLPAALVQAAVYMALAGSVASAVSQAATEAETGDTTADAKEDVDAWQHEVDE